MNAAMIVAIAIFVIMFVLVVMDKIERYIITLVCGLLMLGVVFGIIMKDGSAVMDTLNIKSIITTNFWYATSEESSTGISWSTIIFLAGMMIMVEGMAKEIRGISFGWSSLACLV